MNRKRFYIVFIGIAIIPLTILLYTYYHINHEKKIIEEKAITLLRNRDLEDYIVEKTEYDKVEKKFIVFLLSTETGKQKRVTVFVDEKQNKNDSKIIIE